MRARLRVAPALALGVTALAACSDEAAPGGAPAPTPTSSTESVMPDEGHDHAHDGVSLLVGDGTRSREVGYSLRDVRLPDAPGEPGEVSFRIERYDGSPVTGFLPDHTKDLHLYVVRSDLADFRHLHPAMAADGTWSGVLNLPRPGEYRLITEFVAQDETGRGDHVMLGRAAEVPGDWEPVASDVSDSNDDGVVAVRAVAAPTTGPDGRLELAVSDLAGGPVTLGTYLGAQAHVVGFAEEDGAAVHLHPMGAGTPGPDGTGLTFMTEIERPGPYLFFVQVRVDDFLHTVPVRVDVAAPTAG